MRSGIPDKEDADAGIVLRANETEVIFQIVQAGLSDCITVEVVLSQALIKPGYDMLALHGHCSVLTKKYIAQRVDIILQSSFRTSLISSPLVFLTAPE